MVRGADAAALPAPSTARATKVLSPEPTLPTQVWALPDTVQRQLAVEAGQAIGVVVPPLVHCSSTLARPAPPASVAVLLLFLVVRGRREPGPPAARPAGAGDRGLRDP